MASAAGQGSEAATGQAGTPAAPSAPSTSVPEPTEGVQSAAPTSAPISSPSASDAAKPDAPEAPVELPPNDPSSMAVVLHRPPPPPEEPEIPAPRPRTPPHRRHPPPQPRKGILKPPPPPQAKFSFKRDILAPVSSRLGYAEVAESPLSAVMLGANAGGVGQGVQAAAGWVGNAWKRLGATAAAERAKFEGQTQPAAQARGSPAVAQGATLDPRGKGVEGQTAPRDPSPAARLPPVRRHTDAMAGPSVPTYLRDSTSSSLAASASASSTPSSPTLPPAPTLSVKMLKKVHFTMSDLKVVYNISNVQAPSAEATTKERTETAFQARRRASSVGEARGWTAQSLEALYDECCRTREEDWGLARVRQALKDSSPSPPKALDLTGVQFTLGAIEALGDLLSVDFGLRKLLMEGCGLEDDLLKPLLHALLVSGSLPTLSLANNRRIRTKGWKSVAIFVRKATKLRYLDLSENNLDRRSVEYLTIALNGGSTEALNDTPTGTPRGAASPSFGSLPCSPKHATTSLPGSPVHRSTPLPESIPHAPRLLSEKRPSVSSTASDSTEARLFSEAPLLRDDHGPSAPPTEGIISLRLENCSLRGQALETLAQGFRLSPHLKHISLRRNRISQVGAIALAVLIRDWPTTGNNPFAGMEIEFGPGGTGGVGGEGTPRPPASRFESVNSVTARQAALARPTPAPTPTSNPPAPTHSHAPYVNGSARPTPEEEEEEHFGPERRSLIAASIELESKRAAEARLRLRKTIDPLPRVGCLLTLDVKSNEIRGGAAYLAQVLKRNRTLRVLNLSDNKIEVMGLVALSDALRYNTTLETLDLSRNPCCGPSLEGISALRLACTVNTSLKRIFLTATDLSSEGAIALAEFLPEVKNLIHLDLTENHDIDIAGVMALAVAVKMNTSLRCLDLNIPPNDPDFARLSQDILQSCARNTEAAQAEAVARGTTIPVAAPMLKSAVARELNTRQEVEAVKAERQAKREEEWGLLLSAAEETHQVLFEVVKEDEAKKSPAPDGRVVCGELARELVDQAKAYQIQLTETMKGMKIGELKDRATTVNEQLAAIVMRADALYSGKSSPHRPHPLDPLHSPHLDSGIDDETDSPSFSITDGDSSDDDHPHHPRPSSSSASSRKAENGLRLDLPSGLGPLEGMGGSQLSPRSPVESRAMTLEEGEVFRKGHALGVGVGDDELEGKATEGVSGEELKETILEAQVSRSPRNSFSSPPGSPIARVAARPAAEASSPAEHLRASTLPIRRNSTPPSSASSP